MSSLASNKIEMLKSLIVSAPDAVVLELKDKFSSQPSDGGAVDDLYSMIEHEIADRQIRGAVLGPLAPLFGRDPADGWAAFPGEGYRRLWSSIKTAWAPDVAVVSSLIRYRDPEDVATQACDALCLRAAVALRADDPAFTPVVEVCRPDMLIACLDLAPVVRSAREQIAEWIIRATDKRMAAMRIAYRDAVALSPEGGPRLMDILGAHLDKPWLILRIISSVMDRPTEAYLAASELGIFGERVLTDVEADLEFVRRFDPAVGAEAGRAAALGVQRATASLAEIDDAISLSKDGLWGKRHAAARRTLASAVERRLLQIEDAVADALPQRSIRYTTRLAKLAPRLVAAPDAVAVARVTTLLTFAQETRSSASNGGFGAVRTRVLDQLVTDLDAYVEDALERLRGGVPDEAELARQYLEVAAGFLTLCQGEKAGQIVRRRVAAA